MNSTKQLLKARGTRLLILATLLMFQGELRAQGGITEDQFAGTALDEGRWSRYQTNYTGNTGSVGLDGNGHLLVTLTNTTTSRAIALAYIEAISALPTTEWTAFTAVKFRASATGRSDVDLGFRFVMADGKSAYLQFDSRSAMTLK